MNDQPIDPAPLRQAAQMAIAYLSEMAKRPVGRPIDPDTLRATLGGDLPERGEGPEQVLERLARDADPGLVATAGPRYFGFVIGGSLPVTVATEWLAAAWDQNAGNYPASPAMSVVEEVAGSWLRTLFGLPANASAGFVTGATMANFTGLAAARHGVLHAVGHDVEARGLFDAPPVNVVVGDEAHTTIFVALRMLGLGSERVTRVPVDGQGRMRADELRRALEASTGPTIVCAQAGNVNTGAFDPLREISEAAAERGAWLHLDGAFGLWAATSPGLRHHVDGIERAQSWATDAHKWLNVPYDCGIVFVADPAAHRAAMTVTAAYLVRGAGEAYQAYDHVPESSRHARGLSVYTALRSLGRSGVAELVDRCCALAGRIAERLGAAPGVTILNDVVLNQVLVRFAAPTDDDRGADDRTAAVIAAIQRDGTCWAGGTVWQGRGAMRISVSNWSTTEQDIDDSAEAILRCAASLGVPV
ncbi:MAG TPA: aminotransferase class V-fold PLP-dependent enzyme [Actinomycetota bacterium]|nr:aminotransferase class V-fold PLP-dependent enzyme [Actinomycetota bacterium]